MFDPVAIWSGAFGVGGMLVGGFITYHQVQAKLVDLERRITAVSEELNNARDKFITLRVCETARTACANRMDRTEERQDRLEEKLDAGFNRLYEKLDFIKDTLNHKADR